MSSLRIVVKIPTGTYPELLADLGTVATRARAERLRVSGDDRLEGLASGFVARSGGIELAGPDGGRRNRSEGVSEHDHSQAESGAVIPRSYPGILPR
jgi:hypothetical protein